MKRIVQVFCLVVLLAALVLIEVMRMSTPVVSSVDMHKTEAEEQVEAAPAATAVPAAVVATPAPTPVPTPTPTPEPENYTISLIGDCTLWSNSNYAEHPAGFKGVINGDYTWPFQNTLEYFANDDYTIANLECILSDTKLTYDYTQVYFPFLAPTEYANIMIEGGVDFVTTANNHIMDCYEAGANATYETLEQYGIPYGIEKQAQIVTTDSGLKLGIYCSGTDLLPNENKAVEAIRQLQADGAEYIICAFHWGQELYYEPAASQTNLAQACAEAGADLIYGSHSHCLQPIEEIGDTLVLYSMGNWTFGGSTMPSDPDTAIVQVQLTRNADGTVSRTGYDIIPCCVSSKVQDAQSKAQNYNDYKPTPYAEGTEEYARVMAKLSGEFEPTSQGADYSNWLASKG